MNKQKPNKVKRYKMMFNFPEPLADKIRQKSLEDNLTITAVVINALNFYFNQEEAVKLLPKIVDIYENQKK